MVNNSAESFGTFLAFECNDAPALADTAAWFRARCAAWIGDGFGDRRTEPVRSDIPALVMAGEFDPRTPPEYARLVAAGLTRASVLDIPWHGHEYGLLCVNRIERDFFEAPERPPDAGCLDSLPPLTFTAGVVPSRWIGGIATGVATDPFRVAGPAAVALVLLLVTGVWVAATEVSKPNAASDGRRRRESVALLVAAVIGVVSVIAIAGALIAGSRQGIIVPALGVPRVWVWVLPLPWILGAAAIVSAAVFVMRLRSPDRAGTMRAACVVVGTVLLVSTVVLT